MPRPPKKQFTLLQQLNKINNAGLSHYNNPVVNNPIVPLNERIQQILNLINLKEVGSMTYLIMYDIEKDKVRTRLAKYLEKQGGMRIQKSIFFMNSNTKKFNKIYNTLYEVNNHYQNQDSIIIVPFNTSDFRSLKIKIDV